MSVEKIIEKLNTVEGFSDRYDVKIVGSAAVFIAKDYGDLEVWMTSDSSTTTFKSHLIAVDDISDCNEFNAAILQMMGESKVALSSFGIESTENGSFYVIIGTLSTDSKPNVIMTEINMLTSNAIEMLDSVLV